tara:strand:+ start:251 stop:442 length:192 start_codon:yes stop_codon:yes gene_type:complete
MIEPGVFFETGDSLMLESGCAVGEDIVILELRGSSATIDSFIVGLVEDFGFLLLARVRERFFF